jgi:porphobilinogen synthase
MNHLTRRPRRNRKSDVIRNLVQENHVSTHDLIYPLFVTEGQNQTVAIPSMPGISRFTLDRLLDEVSQCVNLGIKTFAPFPNIPEEKKDRFALESKNPEGLYLRTISEIKRQFPDVILATDVAMD